MSGAGWIVSHFIASSGSSILNSRARVAAYVGSESCSGLAAAPTSMPARSASVLRDGEMGAAATQAIPRTAYLQQPANMRIDRSDRGRRRGGGRGHTPDI